jgi:hypothetical protein
MKRLDAYRPRFSTRYGASHKSFAALQSRLHRVNGLSVRLAE